MNYFKYLVVLFLSVAIVSCGDSDFTDNTDSDTSSPEETSNTDTTAPSVPEETSNTDTTDSSPSIPENTNSTNDAEALKCISGVYSSGTDHNQFGGMVHRYYEVEVSYSPNEVIFLIEEFYYGKVARNLCTSYISPEFQTSENQITLSSLNLISTGGIGLTSGIYDDVIFTKNTEGACSELESKTDKDWSLDPILKPKKTDKKTPRSFSEIKSICDSLSSQEQIL